MSGRPLSLLLILIGLGAVVWWWQSDREPEPSTTTPLSRGYYLKQATIRQTDESGNIMYALTAANIVQDSINERILLEQIELQYQRANDSAWRLQAERGWLNSSAQLASFQGNVQIQPDMHAGQAQLLADNLQVDLVHQQASTADAVTLRMNNQQLTAQGLRADLKSQTLRLESQIHGLFQLPKTVLP